MHLEKREDPGGRYYVRPAYRPEAYRVDPNSLRGILSWRNDPLPTEALLGMHDGPFAGWTELGRFERDGKRWARFYNSSGEYGVDVELVGAGLGEVVELDPKLAYDLAVDHDRKRTDVRIVQL